MYTLNPTLWRTCRVLSGQTRLALLRQLHHRPGQSVSSLARAVHVGLSDASQELRRLQSRGLLQVDRQGRFTVYRLGADPQVPSAAPLLKALKTCLAASSPEQDPSIMQIATGLAHARRIAIAQTLIHSPCALPALQSALHIPQNALSRHVGALLRSGLVRREGRFLFFSPPRHPLAHALARLLRDPSAPILDP